MTGTLNGVGTQLSGKRFLNEQEIKKWAEFLPYRPNVKLHDYKICTKAFVILFFPVIPLETFIYYDLPKNFYQICHFPVGEGKVYWEHVKNSPSFYIAPSIIIILLIIWVISALHVPIFNFN